MPNSRSKAAIVARLQEERARLEETVGSINPVALAEPGVVGEWSVKDVLAHLADWEEHMPIWLDAARRGEPVDGPEPGLTWNQLDEFNRRIFASHRHERLDVVLDYLATAHGRFMEMVAVMAQEELLVPARYAFTGQEAVYDWLVQYAEHDNWATRRIHEWAERVSEVAVR